MVFHLLWNCLVALVPLVCSFNIDIRHKFLQYAIPENASEFGYAISLINNPDTPLIVGAPNFNDGLGAIFKCGVSAQDCKLVNFNEGSPRTDTDRSGQKFGFSLSWVGGQLMACAPKFKLVIETKNEGDISQPVGKCLKFDSKLNKLDSEDEIPCEDIFYKNKPHNMKLPGFGYCLAGTSSTGLPGKGKFDKPIYFLGTPGTRHYSGGTLAVLSDIAPIPTASDKSQVIPPVFPRNYSYIGYSVSAGHVIDREFFGEVLAGAPRGRDMTGYVLLYKLEDKYREYFTWKVDISNPHTQLGSYFGGAVCTCDVNGDGKDDVLVGAPYHAKVLDEGRVYVYMNTLNGKYDKTKGSGQRYDGLVLASEWLEGDNTKGSRFGTTIVNIGDINGDNFNDIAVGAPRADNGAVYIFNGGKNGLQKKYSQVIYASDLPASPRGFGMSIASGFDIDGNKYDELAVGAYLDAKAYVFKSRAVIHVVAKQSTNVSTVPPEEEKMNCYWKNVWYHCIAMNLNLAYFGKGTSDSIMLDVTFSLDDGQKSQKKKRARMIDSRTNKLVSNTVDKVMLKRNETTSIPVVIFVSIGLDIDMQRNITIASSFKARHDPSKCGATPCGILDVYSRNVVVSQVRYEHHCGSDDVCDVDLHTTSSILFPNNPDTGKIVYGKVESFLLNATVANRGEPAFQANMSTVFSDDFLVDRVELNGKAKLIWNIEVSDGKKKLSFLLANPLFKGKAVKIVIKMSVPKSKPAQKSYTFSMNVSSAGRELNPSDNAASITTQTEVDACVYVDGDVSPPYVLLRKDRTESEKYNSSLAVEFDFNIHNGANVPVQTLLTDITMVTKSKNGRLLCVSNITVDDIPCSDIPAESSCEIVLKNLKPSSRGGMEKRSNLTCKDSVCETFHCNISNIPHGRGVRLQIKGQLVKGGFSGIVKTSFGAGVRVTIGDDMFVPRKECRKMEANAVLTVEVPVMQQQPKQIPLWIIIVAAFAALLLLALLIFVLYKKGFFNRKRHQGMAEEEELMNE